jgi:AcrR family transcriptional regulator
MTSASVERPNARRMQDRGVVTRAALVEAAVECLIEDGYAATTTIEVARRAGVSRGAQLHHFPSKAELLTAAVGQLYERRMAEFRKALADVEPGADRFDAAVDLLWSMFAGPTFVAWAEVWLAARTDPDLRVAVIEMDQRCTKESQAIFDELFPPEPGVDPGFYEGARDFAYVVMDGIALQRLVPHDQQIAPEVILNTLKAIAHTFVGPKPPTFSKEMP